MLNCVHWVRGKGCCRNRYSGRMEKMEVGRKVVRVVDTHIVVGAEMMVSVKGGKGLAA